MSARLRSILIALLAACVVAVSAWPMLSRRHPSAASRPGEWAEPLSGNGLPNFHKVTDQLYRGAQPSPEGFRQLKEMGVRTVVNLRSMHEDDEKLLAELGLGYERISFTTWHPEEEDVARFLRIVADPSRQPVFVHCQYGSDRTGMMCAAYRVVVGGWKLDEAVREMTEGGFGFHQSCWNLVDFLYTMNFDALRKQVPSSAMIGLPATAP